MKSQQIRDKFVKFFESKSHKHLPSASLIPNNDPTLLFINAGMVQFKDAFTGKSNPEDKRVVTVQKCVRAGGKHNDLENVGFTARHHTFFEMLGNFSFGDYFKKEAIAYAWEFLTKELQIPQEKLYVTAHYSDQEAADIWHNEVGVPRERIFFRGDKDNFWEMGEVGPCGPCSEIFFDHGPEHTDPNADTSNCLLDDEQRYVEIWNLVFMQYERYKEDGEIKQRNLPKPSVDTGAGLERVVAALQGKYNNFDTDVFSGIIAKIESISGKKYSQFPQWMRVVADHARSCSFLLADGVLPSNEGRGYVLRRIIRRAIRHLDLLGVTQTSFFELVDPVFENFGDLYEENRKNRDFIVKYLRLEEEGFRKTLASGLKLLEKEIEELKNSNKEILDGEKVFTLYDTHGFPLDLTEMILKENALKLDEAGFEAEMTKQKERSKKAGDFSAQADNSKDFYAIKEANGDTEFVGYDSLEVKAKLIGKVSVADKVALIFDKTTFYAEGGGQLGDSGSILDGNQVVATVQDTKKPVDGIYAHICENDSTNIGNEYTLKVNKEARNLTKYNHTATHLLQAALIEVLGSHVKQAGSSVGPKRLRFDFTHPEAVTKEQLVKAEKLVNEQIKKQVEVTPKLMSKDEAMEYGATALFGEKYGDVVRVIDIPGFSVELCGGTHVSNTSEIGYFKILTESSLAAGVRRIEAVTNVAAYEYVDEKLAILENLENLLKAKGDTLVTKATQLIDNLSSSSKEIKSLKEKLQTLNAQSMFEGVSELNNGVVFKHLEASSDDDIRKLGDLFMDKYPRGMTLVTQVAGDKASILVRTFKDNTQHNCSNLLRDALTAFGGRGGGKPDMAQGSVDPSNLNALVEMLLNSIKN